MPMTSRSKTFPRGLRALPQWLKPDRLQMATRPFRARLSLAGGPTESAVSLLVLTQTSKPIVCFLHVRAERSSPSQPSEMWNTSDLNWLESFDLPRRRGPEGRPSKNQPRPEGLGYQPR